MSAIAVAALAWYEARTEERRLMKLRNACRCIHEAPPREDYDPSEGGTYIAPSTNWKEPCWKDTMRHVPPEGNEVEDLSECCEPCLERIRLHKLYREAHRLAGRMHALMSNACRSHLKFVQKQRAALDAEAKL